MDGLIVYGSLINESELTKNRFPFDGASPAVVHGFKRLFSQEPSWRSNRGEKRAVLNVVGSKQHWLNCLLVSGLEDGFFVHQDEREKGYNRIRVDSAYLRLYAPFCVTPIPPNIYIYTGDTNKQSDSILPNESYLRICLEGAKQWGEDFYGDFLDSTFVKDDVPLRIYIENS